jgi:hypothetical protein
LQVPVAPPTSKVSSANAVPADDLAASWPGRRPAPFPGESKMKYETREMTAVELLDRADLEAVTGGGAAGLAAWRTAQIGSAATKTAATRL